MKRRRYGCDGGCLVIGNGSCRVHVPNTYGDGKHMVIVAESNEMLHGMYHGKGDCFRKDWEWIGFVEGDAINVYDEDCFDDNEIDSHVLFTLHGRYSIYRDNDPNSGDILLEGGART